MLLFAVVGTIFVYMVCIWAIAQKINNLSIVDIGWGAGFVVIAVISLMYGGTFTIRQEVVTLLVGLWGIRLSIYLYIRNHDKPEDYRYVAMREKWGNAVALTSFFRVFMLQGVIMLFLAYPIVHVASVDEGTVLNALDYIGIIVWITGFLFESIGDYQLYQFKKNGRNKGQVMMTGVWKYTRHPNYFGECAVWFGIFFIALSTPNGWAMIYSPALITFLLLKVSGIPLLEKKSMEKAEFREYAKKTSVFIPWFPKK